MRGSSCTWQKEEKKSRQATKIDKATYLVEKDVKVSNKEVLFFSIWAFSLNRKRNGPILRTIQE